MTRALLFAASIFALGACGDVEQSLEGAKQEASQIAGEALRAGAAATDTRTACLLAGQSEAFCGCVERQFGSDVSPVQIEAIGQLARETLAGADANTAGADTETSQTRQALLQCAAEGAVGGLASENEP